MANSIDLSNTDLQLVWYTDRNHSEIGVGDTLRYYLGNFDKNKGKRTVSKAIENSGNRPIAVIKIPVKHAIETIEKEIELNPPSKYNTCMGTVAQIIERFAHIKIPYLIRQSPELSALYLMARSKIYSDISMDFHGITPKAAASVALKNGAIQTVMFLMVLQVLFTYFSTVVI